MCGVEPQKNLPVPYSKNIAFTRLIKANGLFREFNFRRKQISGIPVYEVDVSDERGERHYCSLERQNGIWTIREKEVPHWIREASAVFHTVIEEKEAEDVTR